MATLREYFETDLNRHLCRHGDWQLSGASGEQLPPVKARIHCDFDANAKFWSFFIPENVDVRGYVRCILSQELTSRCFLSSNGDDVQCNIRFQPYLDVARSETLIFTKKIFLYLDASIHPDLRREIVEMGQERGFFIDIRDREYSIKKSEFEKPLAFICHDSRDKESLAAKLAFEMAKLHCPVWYDEFKLKVGASLRESIEKGSKQASKCIIILSPKFMSNGGWSKAEFDSIYTREIVEKKNVILPVWHGVGLKEVYEYSPRIADRFALDSRSGVEELARGLVGAVRSVSS